jgi:hypothetical protein
MNELDAIFAGDWTYRSFRDDLLFGSGTISVASAVPNGLRGTIDVDGLQLELIGTRSTGNPMEIRFQGKGVVSGSEWIYAYVGWLVDWPSDISQRAVVVGSVVRVTPHPCTGPDGRQAIAPAGTVASWYAVRQA